MNYVSSYESISKYPILFVIDNCIYRIQQNRLLFGYFDVGFYLFLILQVQRKYLSRMTTTSQVSLLFSKLGGDQSHCLNAHRCAWIYISCILQCSQNVKFKTVWKQIILRFENFWVYYWFKLAIVYQIFVK